MKEYVNLSNENNVEADYLNQSPDHVNYRREYFQYMDIINQNTNDEYTDYTKYVEQTPLVDIRRIYYFYFYEYDNQKNNSTKKIR